MADAKNKLLIDLLLEDKQYKKPIAGIHQSMKDFGKKTELVMNKASKEFAGIFDKQVIEKKQNSILQVINNYASKQLTKVKGNAELENRIIEQAAKARIEIVRQAEERIGKLKSLGMLKENKSGGMLSGLI